MFTLLGINKYITPQLTDSQLSFLIKSLGVRCYYAAYKEVVATGNLNLVRTQPIQTKLISLIAAEYGHTHILEWLVKNEICIDINAHDQAALFGHLETLMFLHKYRNRLWDSAIMLKAAQGEHLHVLQWLHSSGYSRSNFIVAVAVAVGNIEVLEWLLETGSSVDDLTPVYAACACQIKVLKWLQDHGCAKTTHVINAAVKQQPNNTETVAWLLENGWPCDVDYVLGSASDEMKELVLRYKK
jgi:hypothetical protein